MNIRSIYLRPKWYRIARKIIHPPRTIFQTEFFRQKERVQTPSPIRLWKDLGKIFPKIFPKILPKILPNIFPKIFPKIFPNILHKDLSTGLSQDPSKDLSKDLSKVTVFLACAPLVGGENRLRKSSKGARYLALYFYVVMRRF